MHPVSRPTTQPFIFRDVGQQVADATIWSFNTRTEEIKNLGGAAVGSQAHVTSIDADPTGRYLYCIPGAHGGSDVDGSAVVQFDTKTNQKKVIAFLHPFYHDKYKLTPRGTCSTAIDAAGETLYVTWNINRFSRAWDCCGLGVIHSPAGERQP